MRNQSLVSVFISDFNSQNVYLQSYNQKVCIIFVNKVKFLTLSQTKLSF